MRKQIVKDLKINQEADRIYRKVNPLVQPESKFTYELLCKSLSYSMEFVQQEFFDGRTKKEIVILVVNRLLKEWSLADELIDIYLLLDPLIDNIIEFSKNYKKTSKWRCFC